MASASPLLVPTRVAVAQHGRALARNARRRRFDSCRSPHGSVAQLAELPPLKRTVAGSTPAGAIREGLPRARYPVSKTGGPYGLGGSTPSPSALRADAARRASPQGARRDARPEAWPSWQGSALLARRRRAPLAGSSPAASASRCDVVQRVGRPAVTRRMLVRAQPSQSGGGTPGSPTGPPHADRMDPAQLASGCRGSRIERIAVSRLTPRSSSGSRMPASQAGDAGSNPARGLEVGEPPGSQPTPSSWVAHG